ncbi:hypothetical protein Hypma_003583 [Hypsizygus marmoreus]|uniref:Fungal-type protein kinase domain-containing protein n=1 Tax=Hypsizygus marmoreus TaxID=39966 RepID=A0A369J3P8_HYPMA|nr:hypothetical protein Hypma_003583 [Hypsizygus marmoreus]
MVQTPTESNNFTLSGSMSGHASGGYLRTVRLLSDHESRLYDSVTIGDFVKHILGVKSEYLDTILSKRMKWQLNPQLLETYRKELGTQLNFKPAFDALVVDLAHRACHAFNELPDRSKLGYYCRSIVCYPMTPEVVAVPAPLDGDAQVEKGSCLMPITAADLQLVSVAIEHMRNPGTHYAVMILVDVHSVTLRYYDRMRIIRTVSFDIERDIHLFALFAYGISHRNDAFDAPRFVKLARPNVIPFIVPHITFPRLSQSVGKLPSYFVMEPIYYEDYALISRGTIVAAVMNADPALAKAEEVLKASWKHIDPDRMSEAEIIKKMLQEIPSWDNHLPTVKSSATYTATQLKLPAASLLKHLPTNADIKEKELHVMVMSRYKHLWEVRDVLEFQEVFIDCVECHYHAFSEAKVLHRDLSDNNLMFKRSYHHPNHNLQVQGILNDWDLASLLCSSGYLSAADKKRRTGSVPFMAVDLLDDYLPPHVYRHDLESFFYILVWAAVHFDFKNHIKRPVDKLLAPWMLTHGECRTAKIAFLYNERVSSEVFSKVGDDFRGVLEAWIKPLRTLFQQGLEWDQPSSHGYDVHTAGGLLSFEKFMSALGRTPHQFGKG